MMGFAKRTDNNHSDIREGLRALGYEVYDFSKAGEGVADLAVKISPTMSIWLEIKSSKRKAKNIEDKQIIFKMLWFDCYRVVTTIEEARAAIVDVKRHFNIV